MKRLSAFCLVIGFVPTAWTQPATVTLVGSFQSELGCAGDWEPACVASRLVFDAGDEAWQGSFLVPTGGYVYGVALDGSFEQAYGLNGRPLAGNEIPLAVAAASMVKFYYHHPTRWITDSSRTRIVTAPGSYQSETGCPGDWQPDCLRAWLLDIDGDAMFERAIAGLPPGGYEFKVAIGESWSENYGAGGVPGGSNIGFEIVHDDDVAVVRFDGITDVPSVIVVSDRIFRSGFQ